MAYTGKNIEPKVFTYTEINEGKYKEVRHYKITESDNIVLSNACKENIEISETLNISKDRGFARSHPDYWLKVKTQKKWECLTGLFYNKENNLYIGYNGSKTEPKTALYIIKFSKDFRSLKLFYFNYFTSNLNNIIHFIK